MSCIGNSGPLPENISKSINANNLVVTSVLSGNRNFEGRINPDVKANYLAPEHITLNLQRMAGLDLDGDLSMKQS